MHHPFGMARAGNLEPLRMKIFVDHCVVRTLRSCVGLRSKLYSTGASICLDDKPLARIWNDAANFKTLAKHRCKGKYDLPARGIPRGPQHSFDNSKIRTRLIIIIRSNVRHRDRERATCTETSAETSGLSGSHLLSYPTAPSTRYSEIFSFVDTMEDCLSHFWNFRSSKT